MSDEPIIFVLKVPFTERELKQLDALQAVLQLTSSLEVVKVAIARLAEACDEPIPARQS